MRSIMLLAPGKRSRPVPLLLTLLLLTAVTRADANWPRWRGVDDTGSVPDGVYPAKLEKPVWKTPLPGKGCSTPIVFEKRIYVTAPVNGSDAVLALDWNGKEVWQTAFGPEKRGKHRNGSGSNASPATDGKTVFAYFKSGTFAALDLNGKVRWQTNLVESFGPDTLYWDHGTSPVLTEKFVIMTRMHDGESWLAAFDKATGKLQWKVARNYETAVEGDHGYSTPLVLKQGGKERLLVWGAEHITLHDTEAGKVLWTCGEFNTENKPNWPTVASPVTVADLAVVPYGRADRGQPRLHGIKLGASSGSGTGGQRLWKREDVGTFVPTPAVHQGRVYIVRDRGEIECLEPSTGKTLWSDSFPRASANFYASPVIAGSNLYAAREDGVVFVAKIEPKFELISENNLGEKVIASPVPASNRLLMRGEKHLFCFGQD